jgi:hypothetical protein
MCVPVALASHRLNPPTHTLTHTRATKQNTKNTPPLNSAYRKNVLGEEAADSVTCSFFGDGTCNVGQFYEALNMASLYKLPHIFVVENNKWAIGMNHPRATNPTLGDEEPYIYKKGPAFGMPGVLVDGMDVLKVRLLFVCLCFFGGGCFVLSRGRFLASSSTLLKPPHNAHDTH